MKKNLPKFLAVSSLVLFTALILELASFLAINFLLPDGYKRARYLLQGDIEKLKFRKHMTFQPYLVLSPTPNYEESGVIGHNQLGFRGKAVPFEKKENTFRILFLGGSTTYGTEVPFGEKTYPEWVQEILETETKKEIDIINAGIPSGTSAELLTHYHFKYHYFNPDLVVINTGGNDVFATARKNYLPDYSHWRQGQSVIRPLTNFGRSLLKSHLLSLFIVPAVSDFMNPGAVLNDSDSSLSQSAKWFPYANKKEYILDFPELPKKHNAFYQNLNSLIHEIKSRGSQVVLFEFREAPINQYPKGWIKGLRLSGKTLKILSKEHGVEFVPYPQDIISPSNWADSCHVNSAGAKEKAQHLSPFLKKYLK